MVVIAPSVSAFYVSICIYTYIFLSFLFFFSGTCFFGGKEGIFFFFVFFLFLIFVIQVSRLGRIYRGFSFWGEGGWGKGNTHGGIKKSVDKR